MQESNRAIARMQRAAAYLAMPVFRLEMPGWGKIASICDLVNDTVWINAPVQRLRGKLHGYWMTLDLTNWSERQTYFLGRFYDLPTQLCINNILSPGDTFVDIGANVGMITLLAARKLASSGQIHAFEPNPVAHAKLQEHLRSNALDKVKVYNLALSDEPGELMLNVLSEHTGSGTLARCAGDMEKSIVSQHRVKVMRFDDLLTVDSKAPVTVKMDVEGFECHVLRGMKRLLEHPSAAIITEVVDDHLHRAGSSRRELCHQMQAFGYQAFDITSRRRMLRHRLWLIPTRGVDDIQSNNVLWLRPGSPQFERLRWARPQE